MIYFVSGHRDLTEKEFIEHYVNQICYVLERDRYAEFIVGDWEGCDRMFLEYMKDNSNRITVCYCEKLRVNSDLFNYAIKCDSYDECDAKMTELTDFDIAWIRPGREDSHTAQNIKRRFGLLNNNLKPGDWVETCNMTPGILQNIEGDDVEVFYPDRCEINNFTYSGHSHCSLVNCGVHKITSEYAIALLAIGDENLKKLYTDNNITNTKDWEELVINTYNQLKKC